MLYSPGDETAQLLSSMAHMSKELTTLVASLRDSSENVLHGANEIAKGGQELAARTEQQAAALQETASSMEEMTATARIVIQPKRLIRWPIMLRNRCKAVAKKFPEVWN